MSLTQKRFLQIPLFLAIVLVVVLPLEWSLFSQLPWGLGHFGVFSILLTYIACTRGLVKTVFLAIVIGYFSSLAYPFAFGAVIAAQAWATLAAKLMTYTMPFDSKPLFSLLVCFQALLSRILWRLLTLIEYKGISWMSFAAHVLPSMLTLYVAAYLSLSLLVLWDEFFENSPSTGAELAPRITGMSR